MKIAIQTLLLPGDSLDERFANAARFGFDAVEVAVGPTFDLAARLPEVRRSMVGSGLPIAAICTHPMHDPFVPDLAERERRWAALAELMRLADELGAGGVVSVPVRPPHAFPGPDDAAGEPFALAAAALRDWAERLPTGGGRLFLEPLNRYEAAFLNRVGQAVDLARRVDHPRVTALADLFHMNIEEADLGAPLREAGARLGHVHVADNNRLQPGAGCLDFRPPFAALKATGYEGYISIECFSPGGPRIAGDPEAALPATARFLREVWAAA